VDVLALTAQWLLAACGINMQKGATTKTESHPNTRIHPFIQTVASSTFGKMRAERNALREI